MPYGNNDLSNMHDSACAFVKYQLGKSSDSEIIMSLTETFQHCIESAFGLLEGNKNMPEPGISITGHRMRNPSSGN